MRAVVAGEQHERTFGHPGVAQRPDQRGDVGVEPGDLGGVAAVRGAPRPVLVPAGVAGDRARRVRQVAGEVQQKGPVVVLPDELDRALAEQVRRVRPATEMHLLVVVPQVRGKVLVGVDMLDVAVELVEAAHVGVGVLVRLLGSETPLSDARRTVAGQPQHLGEGEVGVGERVLPPALRVLPHGAVAGVQPGEQRAPRRRAQRRARVRGLELHALGRQPVQVGGADGALPVAADLPPSQVVGQDEQDVRPRGQGAAAGGGLGARGGGRGQGEAGESTGE